MKVAICVSGLIREKHKRNIGSVKNAFPDADIFYSTWEAYEDDKSRSYKCKYYPEPQMHYNPWKDCVTDNPHPKYHAYKKDFVNNTGTSSQGKLLNATKQIIAHAYQVADLPEEYDMVVRTRWDTIVGDRVDFNHYLNTSYEHDMAIGFAIRGGRWIHLNKFQDIEHVYITETTDQAWSRDWAWWLNDNLIIHPRKIFDTENVHKLHEEKKLWPAEYGWYQVLSKDDNHHCVYGGAALDRFARA
tara:strand:- start:1843 stop:2574 length:732 start_codon:yes stop_codon:yes gene_type:complete